MKDFNCIILIQKSDLKNVKLGYINFFIFKHSISVAFQFTISFLIFRSVQPSFRNNKGNKKNRFSKDGFDPVSWNVLPLKSQINK